MKKPKRDDRENARGAHGARAETPANVLLEKTLVNLRVLGQLREGDKLSFSADGFFLLQRPLSRVAVVFFMVSRAVSRTSRWETLARVNEVIGAAQMYHTREDRERVQEAVRDAMPGLRALQRTYSDDALLVQSLEVLVDRVRRHFGFERAS